MHITQISQIFAEEPIFIPEVPVRIYNYFNEPENL